MTYKEWQKEEHGYDCLTTYFDDFSIADRFGEKAIRDTYKTARKNETDYKILTEIVMVLNHKLWQHYERGDQEKAKVYDSLWRELDSYLCNNLRGEELQYFLRTTD